MAQYDVSEIAIGSDSYVLKDGAMRGALEKLGLTIYNGQLYIQPYSGEEEE